MKKIFLPCFIIVLIATVLAFCLSVNNGEYIDNNDDWIGFVGSIAGGILTLYGVLWTINDNEKQHREDNKPIIVPNVTIIHHDTIGEVKSVKLLIELKNVGKSLATDFKYDDYFSKRNDTDGDGLTTSNLLPGNHFKIIVNVPYNNISDLNFYFDIWFTYDALKTRYHLKYEGEFTRKSYDELICYIGLKDYKEEKTKY